MNTIRSPRTGRFLVLILAPFLLGSCLGLSLDIVLNPNGSSTVTVEYQVNKSLEALGRLDGNERWHTIPTGRADFERSLDRLPGASLLSFSTREDSTNIINTARLSFQDLAGLLTFLDAPGGLSSFSGEAGSGRLLLTLSRGQEDPNPALLQLLEAISESYGVSISLSLPGEGLLTVRDMQGNPLGGFSPERGRQLRFSLPIYQVLTAEEGMQLDFSW